MGKNVTQVYWSDFAKLGRSSPSDETLRVKLRPYEENFGVA